MVAHASSQDLSAPRAELRAAFKAYIEDPVTVLVQVVGRLAPCIGARNPVSRMP